MVSNKMKKYSHSYPFHLIEYKPSVDEELKLKFKSKNN